MEIKKAHTQRYYGEYTGPETDEGYKDPANYKPGELRDLQFLVIHGTEGYEHGDRSILSGNSDRRVSAHYYIPLVGGVTEYVDPTVRAWHAGGSSYRLDGKLWEKFNFISIGIELECRYIEDPKNGCSDYTEAQMSTLITLHKYLQGRFPILKDPRRTVGHEDISGYRGKKDPGPAFNWDKFRLGAFEDQKLSPPPLSVTVNGETLSQKLILVDGRAYLPLRTVADACGLTVRWFAQDKRVELETKDFKQ